MGCLALLVAFLTPRFVIVVLWLFSDYLARAFQSGWWALAGFFFLPTTTIGYAIAQNAFSAPNGGVSAGGIIVIAIGVAVDLGLLGGGGRGLGKRNEWRRGA